MRNFFFVCCLLFAAMQLTAQTAITESTELTENPISIDKGTRMQVTVIYADGSRRMQYIKISETPDYFYLELPGANVRYAKAHDVATQYDGSVTTKLLSNYWIKTQLVYDNKNLVMVDGAVSDGAGNQYQFQYGD